METVLGCVLEWADTPMLFHDHKVAVNVFSSVGSIILLWDIFLTPTIPSAA